MELLEVHVCGTLFQHGMHFYEYYLHVSCVNNLKVLLFDCIVVVQFEAGSQSRTVLEGGSATLNIALDRAHSTEARVTVSSEDGSARCESIIVVIIVVTIVTHMQMHSTH